MSLYPSEEEIDRAVWLLVNRYSVTAPLLGKLLGREQRERANGLLRRFGGNRLGREDTARLVIFARGSDLFGGSSPEVRELRLHLLSQLKPAALKALYDRNPTKANLSQLARIATKLSEKPWHADGTWPHDFVTVLGFPAIFAGVKERVHRPTVFEVPPVVKPPPLQPFQKTLKDGLLSVMEREQDRTRCIVSLPTGGGKTRVAVEAFIEWMQPRFAQGQYLLWVAQSEELCEQAIACLVQMWGSREYLRPLRVYRFYGGRTMDVGELRGGAVISSISQIHNRIKAQDPVLDELLAYTGVLIIDEAHRAVTMMYDGLLDRARELRGEDLFPICGLTATPGRAGQDGQTETERLVGRFEALLLKPSLGPGYGTDPLRCFREHGYLATPVHQPLRGKEYELTAAEIKGLASEEDFPATFRRRLADDNDRNKAIVQRLMEIPEGVPTLVYACTVEHAFLLAMILRSLGRTAAAISSDTSLTLRRGFIEQFKSGEVQFLCNYGVLTTGFDAPKTEVIVLCRPTQSAVLYEQIIGRGLRGPRFGGTERCTIIDFADNIKKHGAPLAYVRFSSFWEGEHTGSAAVGT